MKSLTSFSSDAKPTRPLRPPDLIVPLIRPLVPLEVAAFMLDRSRNQVLSAILETGEIDWAFDLRAPGTRRSLVRIYFRSVLGYRTGNYSLDTPQAIMQSVLPVGPPLTTSALCRALAVDSDHLYSFNRELKVLKRGKPYPGGQAIYERNSAVAWLTSRRLT